MDVLLYLYLTCALCPYQQASHTLMYLNLQSNNLTDIGVRAIGLQLSRKQTLRRLLIDGNPFTPDSAIFAQRELLRSGAQVHLIWTPSAGRVGVTASEDDRLVIANYFV